jgi:hypothetical protein
VFGWALTLIKAIVGCDFEKSSFGKVVVRWMEASLVELLWLLGKYPHFQVCPHGMHIYGSFLLHPDLRHEAPVMGDRQRRGRRPHVWSSARPS